MNKYLLSGLFITFNVLNLLLQNVVKNPDISEIRKNKYQIEVGFSSFQNVYRNTASGTIFFKKKINPGELIDVTSIRYLRTFLTLNSEFRLSDNMETTPNLNSVFDQLTHPEKEITLGFGFEKQFQNRRFIHYYGCDAFVNYYDKTSFRYGSYSSGFNNVSRTEVYRNEQGINGGLIPFIGLKYYFSDQFSVGLETGFSISYDDKNYKNIEYISDDLNREPLLTKTESEPFSQNSILLKFLGLRFITIGYSFK